MGWITMEMGNCIFICNLLFDTPPPFMHSSYNLNFELTWGPLVRSTFLASDLFLVEGSMHVTEQSSRSVWEYFSAFLPQLSSFFLMTYSFSITWFGNFASDAFNEILYLILPSKEDLHFLTFQHPGLWRELVQDTPSFSSTTLCIFL